ncbi:MAG: hypothetical protein ABII00_11920 [Elusimicrobiota bacterium]
MEGRQDPTILDKVGVRGLLWVVWYATPGVVRFWALPYSFLAYLSLARCSSTLAQLAELHAETYRRSLLFRYLRPRFRKIQTLLSERYGVK